MKKYPHYNWKKLDLLSQRKFDEMEEVIIQYLNMDWWKYPNKVIAYNLAYLILTK